MTVAQFAMWKTTEAALRGLCCLLTFASFPSSIHLGHHPRTALLYCLHPCLSIPFVVFVKAHSMKDLFTKPEALCGLRRRSAGVGAAKGGCYRFALAIDRAISTMSSREAVGSSLLQAMPRPIRILASRHLLIPSSKSPPLAPPSSRQACAV